MRRICIPLLAALLAGAVPGEAAAQREPGVFLDPDTPAGKEYAIPLERARREAAGSGGSSLRRGGSERAAAESAPLFGAGIAAKGRRGKGSSNRPRDGSSRSGDDRGVATPDAGRRRGASPAAAKSSSVNLEVAGIAAAILLAGALLGLLLRRVLRQP